MVVVESATRLELITGPARSGKSLWAERRASASGQAVHYLATGSEWPQDAAWQERLRRHRQRRPPEWTCREVGLDLASCLPGYGPEDLVLIDSLGTWVSRSLELDGPAWERLSEHLLEALRHCRASVLLVSEQVGWGVVPATAIGGLFRDRLGQLEEAISPLCVHLWLVLAGRALDLLPCSLPVACPRE
jgi:adenosylcobinamide kinase/adenosylcobinamide-phosphate guanylyltransferase